MNVAYRIVAHGGPEYLATVELRRRILRRPLGLDFSDEELASEHTQTHFAAQREGEIVGCLVMVPVSCSIVKMRQVAVEPRLQGAGIGSGLVAAAEKWARESNYSRIELHARQEAVAFYDRLAYRREGPPFVEVTIPHQKMVKDLFPTGPA